MAGTLDTATFGKRLKALYDSFESKKDSCWANADSVLIFAGPSANDLRYNKSACLQQWLMGYEVPETIMAFLPSEITIITSEKKAKFLEPLVAVAKEQGKDLKLVVRPKGDDGAALVQDIIGSLSSTGPRVGVLAKERHEGKVAVALYAALEGAEGLEKVDVAPGVSDLLSDKDDAQVLFAKKSAYLAASVMEKFLVKKVEEVLDKGLRVKHSKLGEEAEAAIMEPTKIQVKLKREQCDIAFPPVLQSGGKYSLKLGAQSNDDSLHAGVVVASLGAKYSGYCSAVARTYFVDASAEQKAQYEALLEAAEEVRKALVPGAALSEVYEAGLASLRSKDGPGLAGLADKVSKNFGFATGLELRDSLLTISPKTAARVRAGMTFVVSLGLEDLKMETKDEKRQTYAIQVGDTVLVVPTGPAEILTGEAKRTFADVAYNLDAEEDMEEDKPVVVGADGKTLRSDAGIVQAEAIRRKKQEELTKRANQSTIARIQAAKDKLEGGGNAAVVRSADQIVSYRSLNEVPPRNTLAVQVDQETASLLLPIYGVLVPFHISTLKQIQIVDTADKELATIRVIFNVPGSFTGKQYDAATRFPTATFIKELSFKSADPKAALKMVQEVKNIQRQASAKDREAAAKASLVVQGKLQFAKGKVPALRDVWVRPAVGGRGRKVPGTLDAHLNGFRYHTPRTEEVIDILYSNIKHAFFQPAEKEVMTIVHFHLHNSIMVNKKKTQDVQFYVEVMEAVQTLDGGRGRFGHDQDELEEEQRERERRNRINKEFDAFTKRVQEQWERDKTTDVEGRELEWDMTYRALAFDGVPHKSMCTLLPTNYCLVELIEMPFTVITLSEVEVVNLERAALHLKNFDMAIVNKDFSKDVVRIEAIPIKSLEPIKEWLNSVSIKYYESKANLNWKTVIRAIMDDPEEFEKNGGWEFLNLEASDEENEEDNEGDSDFAPTEDSDDDEDEEDGDSEDESLASEDSDGSAYSGEDSDMSEGKDWSDLEDEARRADDDGDSEDDRPRKKGGAPPVGAKRKPQGPPPGRGGAPPPKRPAVGGAGRPAMPPPRKPGGLPPPKKPLGKR